MSGAGLLNKLRDPYDLRARVAPGLWIIFPLLTAAICLVGPKHPLLTALLSLASACGGPYLLGSIVRTWGTNAQTKLYIKWGGMPTTMLLRHRDKTIDTFSKQRYHEAITRKFGIPLPSFDEEKANPDFADEAYRSATEQLISLTRDTKKFSLLFKELIAYGFNRNMYGARWVGSAICLTAMAIVLIHAHVVGLTTPSMNPGKIEGMSIGEWITFGISLGLLLTWLFHFTGHTVKGAGIAYAKRLLECLGKVSAPPSRRAKGNEGVAESVEKEPSI